MKLKKYSSLFAFGTLALAACASPSRAPLAANADPKAEIDKTTADIRDAEQKQYNLLAPENFARAVKYKKAAEDDLNNGKDSSKTLDDIAISEQAIREVQHVGSANSASVEKILSAREYALQAQALELENKEFLSADADLADMGHDMEKGSFKMDAKKSADLEMLYSDAEINARKSSELHGAKAMIEKAENDDAKSKTPQLYQEACAKVASAEHAIEISPHASSGYSDAVNDANASAKKLSEVLALARQNNSSEATALALWSKNREIESEKMALNNADTKAAAEKAALESQIDKKDASLYTLQTENKQYANEEELKQRIEEIKKTFSPDEAEVMKDGKNIVVRLKKMDFASGRSDLNPNSFETLKKVDTLIAAVPAKEVTVEGHTDSVGPNSVNKTLSEKRAESVKKYLVSQDFPKQLDVETVGYGADKPLTTNKTKEGRATNRRVDIVIGTSVVL